MKTRTQGRRLIALLKRKAMTYREMLEATESTSPWRRVAECLGEGEQVVKVMTAKGWTAWGVVRSNTAPARI